MLAKGINAALRPERALPVACLLAAAVLAASELMDTFQFVPAAGDPLDGQTGGERHGYALLILATFAAAATLALVASGVAPLAISIAIAGAIALLVFLTLDLPDVNSIGNLDDGIVALADVEAEARAGFWLELIGALGLTVAGTWLALLAPEQRMAPARALAERRREPKRRPAAKREQVRPRRATGPRATKPDARRDGPPPSRRGA